MREPEDFPAFSKLLTGIAEFYKEGRELSATYKAIYFKALVSELTLAEVEAGFMAHLRDPSRRSDFMPQPGAIIAAVRALSENDGRPGAEEAFTIALRSVDERDTVVWTAETARAWDQVRVTYSPRNQVAARMAFKEVYERLVADARRAHQPVEWIVAEGHDPAGRRAAIEAAIVAGRLPAPETEAPKLLEGPRGADGTLAVLPPPTLGERLEALPDGQACDPLRVFALAPPTIRERLRAWRERVTGGDPESRDAILRQRTEQLRREAAERVAEVAPHVPAVDLHAGPLPRKFVAPTIQH